VKFFTMGQLLPASGPMTGFRSRDVPLRAAFLGMWSIRLILAWVLLAGASVPGQGAETIRAVTEAEAASQEAPAKPEEHGLTAKAVEIWAPRMPFLGRFPVTNSMLVSWVVALGLIVFAQLSTRRMKEIPDGAQNFWEWLVESLYNFLKELIGPDLVKKTFWFFATIFIFILFSNWFGLIPGVGTIGWGHHTARGFEISRPLLRGGNADLNMTAAMASIFMVLWFIWALQSNGIWGFTLHLFGPKGESSGFIKYLMIVIFFAVGFLEVISIAFRPISLSFRLFGNIFAGENLLEAMSNVVQHPPWAKALFSALLPAPFYFLELLVGLVQAFVFMLLTTVFTALICTHEEAPGKEPH
jgi:F-type H+-transporting ATPase subunit a